MSTADDLSDKRLEDEVQRYRDLLDEASRQISSMSLRLLLCFYYYIVFKKTEGKVAALNR